MNQPLFNKYPLPHSLLRKERVLFFSLPMVFILLATLFAPQATHAQGQYMSTTDFLTKAFGKEDIAPDILWLNKESKATAEEIMQHPISALRIRYWKSDKKTAWIINEIGKEKPITIGIVIIDNQIESVDILEFRETRGWEVRNEFFTDQFHKLKRNNNQLDGRIDGITGATLSVSAVKRSATLALYLAELVSQNAGDRRDAP